MTDKELIKQEIEYRLSSGKYSINSKQALEDIIVFIDTLPEEPTSEDLEEASEEYAFTNWESDDYHEGAEEDIPFDPIGHTKKCFIAGAEWQKQQIKEALQTEYEKGRFDMREEMIKDAVDGEVAYQIGNSVLAPTDIRYKVVSDRVYIPNVKLGDKVKIIICKTEQQ